MKVILHAHQLSAPRGVSAYLLKHVVRPLQRVYDSPAAELRVLVEDARPRKGGVDQACRITFRMPGARSMRVESVQTDLHAALLEASQRLRRLVQRQLQKSRSPSRSPAHRPLGRTWRRRATGGDTAPDGTPSTL